MSLYESFVGLDQALVAAGFPPTSAWWLATLERFLGSSRRQLVLRVGRRGGKSSTLCRLAVVLALAGDHQIPPGDVGVVAFISTTRDEAGQRLRTIEAILRALRVPFRRSGDAIELTDRPVTFKVFVASIAGVVGFTAIAAICDEVARWRDSDSGANPAGEVLASLRPTMATQRQAPLILSSSPLGPNDAHAKAYDEGETRRQMVAYAPSWVANPTLTEAETREDEPDARIWTREYLAVPQASKLAAFDVAAIDRSMLDRKPDETGEPILVLDPSSGRRDAWVGAVVRSARDERGPFVWIEHIDAIEGSFWTQTTGDQVVERFVTLCRDRGITSVHADQREQLMLQAAFERAGLTYHVHTWTQASKVTAVETVRRWFRDRTIAITAHPKMRAELVAFEERVTASGSLSFDGRRSSDDYVAVLVTGAMADAAGRLPQIGSGGDAATGGRPRAWFGFMPSRRR